MCSLNRGDISTMKAYLMHKDDTIAELYIDKYGYRLEKSYINMFPVRSNVEFSRWWHYRQTPYSRTYMGDVYEYLGIKTYEDFIKLTGFLSVNDCWWIKTRDNQHWSSHNPFENHFNSFISNMSVGGLRDYGGKTGGFVYSPEFTLGGSFPKTWRHRNGDIVLLKGGNINYIYSELLANQVYEYLGINKYVRYNLEVYKGIDVCSCKCFTSGDIEYHPIIYYTGHNPTYEEAKKILGGTELFYQMCLVDCILLNVDRYGGNFGFLVDADTLGVVGMSPVYDNNWCLLTDTDCNERLSSELFVWLLSRKRSRFDNMNFLDLGKLVISDYSKSRGYLEQMSDFEFKKVGSIEKSRLDFLTKLVRAMSYYLLRGV